MSAPVAASAARVNSAKPEEVPFYEQKWFAPVLGGSGVAVLLIAVFSLTANFVGTSSTWNAIGDKVNKIWVMSFFGSLLLFIVSIVYFNQDSPKTIYFILLLLCLTLGFSYSALAVAAITSQ
jgi:hypothetical protein